MVMTTKHHEGFCQFSTKLTDLLRAQAGPGARPGEGVRGGRARRGAAVGFYHSLMDWQPSRRRAMRQPTKPPGRRFRRLRARPDPRAAHNYGKIDVLWYDVAWPLDAKGWESEKMNEMVFQLQPEIVVNNRNKLDGDFATPEQRIQAEAKRAWESWHDHEDSWGYQTTDDDWKSPKTVVRNLVTCAHGTGNYLLNIGPKPDGSIPEESVRILTAVGQVDGPERQVDLRHRRMPAGALELCGIHAQGQHAVHARILLAWGNRGAGAS